MSTESFIEMHRPLPDEIYGDIVAYNGCEGLCNVETPPPPNCELSTWKYRNKTLQV